MRFCPLNLHFRSPSTVGLAAGLVCIAVGILVPSFTLISSVRTIPSALAESLTNGATLFRAGLILLGFVIILARQVNWGTAGSILEFVSQRRYRRELFVGLALMLTAFLLRIYRLESGLWHDEIRAYLDYTKLPLGELVTVYDSETHHILYDLLAHLSFMIFGESGWALRLPAVLFGTASIGALYLLGRQVGNTREAFLASALLVVSYHHIWFSQNARGYTALLFWTLLSSWLLLRALQTRQRLLWPAYAVAIALGVYSHLTMVFVVVGQFVVYLGFVLFNRHLTQADRWMGLIWGFVLGGLFTFDLYALVFPQVLASLKATISEVAAWKQPIWTVTELLNGLEVNFGSGLVAVAALVVFGAGLLSYARKGSALVVMLIVPPMLGAAVTIAAGHHLWPRFFFFAFGFAALVAVRGAMEIGRQIDTLFRLPVNRWATTGTILALGLVIVSAKSVPYVYEPKQDYAGALDYIESIAQPGDAVVTVGLASFTYRELYRLNWPDVKTLVELNTVRASSKRTLLVYTLAPEVEATYPDIFHSIQQDFTVVKQFYGSVGDGTIFVCVAGIPTTKVSQDSVLVHAARQPSEAWFWLHD